MFRLAIEQTVAVSDKQSIEARIKTTWFTFNSIYLNIIIKIQTTEVYVNLNKLVAPRRTPYAPLCTPPYRDPLPRPPPLYSNYYNVLMYTATLNGANIRPQDLQFNLPPPDLSGLTAPDGRQYTVYAEVSGVELLRYSQGTSVTIDRWVLDVDLVSVMAAIEGVVNANRPGQCVTVYSLHFVLFDLFSLSSVI